MSKTHKLCYHIKIFCNIFDVQKEYKCHMLLICNQVTKNTFTFPLIFIIFLRVFKKIITKTVYIYNCLSTKCYDYNLNHLNDLRCS